MEKVIVEYDNDKVITYDVVLWRTYKKGKKEVLQQNIPALLNNSSVVSYKIVEPKRKRGDGESLSSKYESKNVKEDILKEFQTYDKDVRTLTYKVLLEKFNNKYDTLTISQKQVLKEYINSVDSTPDLRNFYNVKINELKNTLSKETKNIKDKATKIKITEVTKFLTELKKTDKVGDNNLVDLLRYYQLVNEIQIANGI